MGVGAAAAVKAVEWGVAPDLGTQALVVFFAEGGFAEVDDAPIDVKPRVEDRLL